MKTLRRTCFVCFSVSLALISFAWAGSMPEMHVTVTSASGKVVYKGETEGSGTFTTPTLPPGHYTVLWHSAGSAKSRYDLTVAGGKGVAVAEGVSGSRFSGGGVAMKVEVGPSAGSMNGHIGAVGSASAGTTTTKSARTGSGASASSSSAAMHPDGETRENGVRVKYEHGKKYVWYVPEMSTVGARWVPADSREGQSVKGVKTLSGPESQSDR